MKYVIDNLGQHGIIDDVPYHEIPDNAFSSGLNVKFSEGKVSKYKGWAQVFGLPITTLKLKLTSYAPTITT